MDDMPASLGNNSLYSKKRNEITRLRSEMVTYTSTVNYLKETSRISKSFETVLEHHRRDENSYVLEATNVKDGSPTFVKYEGDDMHLDEIGLETKANSGSHTSQGRRLYPGKRKWSEVSLGQERGETSDPERRGFMILRGEDCHLVDVDAEYELVLKHLWIHGKSYALEMTNKDGFHVFVKYEGGHDGSESVTRGNTSMRRSCHASKRNWTKGSWRQKSGNTIRPYSLPVSQEVERPYVDETYHIFLSHLRSCDASMIFEMHNGISFKYGKDDESRIASTITETKGSRYAGEQSKCCESYHVLDNSLEHGIVGSLRDCLKNSNTSYFERKLMASIMKPFDQNEYEDLLYEATRHRLVERQRHLRGGTKSYETKTMGRSYLDHHPDVAQHIKSADRGRGLTLLRVFIFWLKNLSHTGSFKPWNSRALTECQSPDLRRFLQTALALD